MKYYGIKRKILEETITYNYARTIALAKSFFPGKKGKRYREQFKFIYDTDHSIHGDYNNALPDNHFFTLDQFVTSDLIYREDIGRLQDGIRRLIRKHKAGSDRFIYTLSDSLQELANKVDKMDSTLLSWYDGLDCGLFDFRNSMSCDSIDYFGMTVRNINSSYLSLEFTIHLSDKKKRELDQLIASNYEEPRGYINKMLTSRKEGGAVDFYTVSHYPDEVLKADRIYEWISCVEWEFFNKMKDFFPLILHNKNLIPPRIEIYYTDIDYHDKNRVFWDSIGISDYQGQFIDERQKMFFETRCSGRYDHTELASRLLYIIKDDGIEPGRLRSAKDVVYFHIDRYISNYFKFLFLGIISRQAGKNIVRFKRQLGRIKLKKNKLKNVLKLRYEFERCIDPYVRYSREDIWTRSLHLLEKDIFDESDKLLKMAKKPFLITYKSFANDALAGAKKIDSTISVIRNDFDDKERILQHLADYRDSKKNWWLNIVMVMISTITLIFVIFPEKAGWVADIIRNILNWITWH